MDPRYVRWIEDFKGRNNGFLRGLCRSATAELVEAFPELTEVRGHAHSVYGKDAHTWAVTTDGDIVDPTRDQYPGPIDYETWRPGDEVMAGRCMNCGEGIWVPMESLNGYPHASNFCSKSCANETVAYLQGPPMGLGL